MSGASGRLTLAFASLAHAYAHMFVLFFATVVLVLEHEWGMDYADLFALSIPGAIMFGAGALPAGWLGDRWSNAGMIAVFFLGTGAASVLTGLADSPLGLAIGLTLIGTFASIYHPVGIPWLLKHARNRGRALGWNGVFGSLGTAAAALIAGLLADLLGWRAAFIVPGAVCVATGMAFLAVLRLGRVVEVTEDVVPQPATERSDRLRAFLALAVTVTCTGLIYQATSYALPKIFEERLVTAIGQSVLGIGGLVTVCYVIAGFTQLIGGELADRYPQKQVYVWCMAAQAPVYIVAFLVFSPVLVPLATLLIALNVITQPTENSLLARYTPMQWRGQVFGAKFVLTLGVSAIGVALVPLIHKTTGSLSGLFIALMATAVLATVAAATLPGDRRRRMAMAPAE